MTNWDNAFMKPEVTKEDFWQLDDTNGITLYPCDCVSKDEVKKEGRKIVSIKKIHGIFARVSAPGYLDASDWAGPFASEKDAMAYLEEYYGDQDDYTDEDEPNEDETFED